MSLERNGISVISQSPPLENIFCGKKITQLTKEQFQRKYSDSCCSNILVCQDILCRVFSSSWTGLCTSSSSSSSSYCILSSVTIMAGFYTSICVQLWIILLTAAPNIYKGMPHSGMIHNQNWDHRANGKVMMVDVSSYKITLIINTVCDLCLGPLRCFIHSCFTGGYKDTCYATVKLVEIDGGQSTQSEYIDSQLIVICLQYDTTNKEKQSSFTKQVK